MSETFSSCLTIGAVNFKVDLIFFFMGVFFIGQALLGSGCGSLQHRHQLL
jgi:hypothetical protein